MSFRVFTGLVANDGTGDSIRTAFQKVNGAIAGVGVSVEQYGADSTGLTDSTQAFIDAISEVGYRGVLSVPAGTYLLSSLNIAKSDFSIVGDGVLLCSGSVNAWVTIASINVTIDGPTFDGGNKAETLLVANDGSTDWKVRRCAFKNASCNDDNNPTKNGSANGVLIRNACQKISFDECRFEDFTYDGQGGVDGNTRFCAGIYGAVFNGTSSADNIRRIRISNCEFYNVGLGKFNADAIRFQNFDVQSPSAILVSDCICEGSGWRFVKLIAGGAKVTGNWILSNEPGPISVRGMYSAVSAYGSNIVIADNVFIGGACYRVFDAESTSLGRVQNITVKGNEMILPSADGTYDPQTDSDGIFLASVKGATISGNIVRNARFGVSLQGLCEGVTVGPNSLLDLGTVGVYLHAETTDATYLNTYPTNCSIAAIAADGFTNYGVQCDSGCTKIAIVGTQTDGGGFAAVNRGSGVSGASAANFGEILPLVASTTNANYEARIVANASGTNSIQVYGPFGNQIASYSDTGQSWSIGRTSGTVTINGTFIIANNVKIVSGSGSPEGVVTAAIGSHYHRTDGGAATSFYVKESGAGNTGWVGK